MHVINADNVNTALSMGLEYLLKYGIPEESRNGTVIVSPVPVTTAYSRPWERVLFSPLRDANPFFHLMESLWMLAGRNDLEFPHMFNKRFGEYSDDGKTLRGAYGHRWRHWFGYDQLEVISKELIANPASRRCVLAMWDASDVPVESLRDCLTEDNPNLATFGDLLATTVDKPCNTHIYFRVNAGKLDMTVCCRSNDILWGAYGANVVHMSFLQEYMAAAIGVPIGTYFQISNNFHLYTGVVNQLKAQAMATQAVTFNYYRAGMCAGSWKYGKHAQLLPLVDNFSTFDKDLQKFFDDPDGLHTYTNAFFTYVALPMHKVWFARRAGAEVFNMMGEIKDQAWQMACRMWVDRRNNEKKEALIV